MVFALHVSDTIRDITAHPTSPRYGRCSPIQFLWWFIVAEPYSPQAVSTSRVGTSATKTRKGFLNMLVTSFVGLV